MDSRDRDLGTLGGSGAITALGVNSNCQVAGIAPSTFYNSAHAFLWAGSMQDLGTLAGPNTTSAAYAINDGGVVAGTSNTTYTSGLRHTVIWDSKGCLDLGTLGGNNSEAHAINNSGQVAGWSQISTGREHAFVGTVSGLQDLGTLGGGSSRAYGINNTGQVVGWAKNKDEADRAFLWTAAGMQDLGTLGGSRSQAYGINSSRWVVGWSKIKYENDRAFLWTPASGLQDLSSLVINLPEGIFLEKANAINDAGQIAGITTYGHAFLLTPVP